MVANETGGIMISPLAGITPNKPAHATLPLPGIQPIIVDADGNELIGNNVEGNLYKISLAFNDKNNLWGSQKM